MPLSLQGESLIFGCQPFCFSLLSYQLQGYQQPCWRGSRTLTAWASALAWGVITLRTWIDAFQFIVSHYSKLSAFCFSSPCITRTTAWTRVCPRPSWKVRILPFTLPTGCRVGLFEVRPLRRYFPKDVSTYIRWRRRLIHHRRPFLSGCHRRMQPADRTPNPYSSTLGLSLPQVSDVEIITIMSFLGSWTPGQTTGPL